MVKSHVLLEVQSQTVVTVDGSPHCFTPHTSLNTAKYILGENIEGKHYVVVDGRELYEVKPDAVRVARYLHLVEQLVREKPEVNALQTIQPHRPLHRLFYHQPTL